MTGGDAELDQRETPAVACRNIRFQWPGGDGFRLEIDDFALARGDHAALIGPSGSGKSTLLNLMTGLTRPQKGVVEVLGSPISEWRGPARDRFRAENIGVVFQLFNLLSYADVLDNVLLPLQFGRARRARVADPKTEAMRLLTALGLPEGAASEPASTLSVGQQQRVAAARALIGGPALIVGDEPSSALDPAHREGFLDLLFAEAERQGTTVLVVTHDPAVAARFDQRIALGDLTRRAAA